ncbi:MAG: sulfite exporter TauE/SafE family protein [Steroidobacteraceae bacterium]
MIEVAPVALFLAGLLGSTHCLAMCGGIATALGSSGARNGLRHPLLYQLGRITSYICAGGVAGAIGAAGASLASSHWRDSLRLGTAVVVILIGVNLALGSAHRPAWLALPERLGGRLWQRLAPPVRARLPTQPSLRAYSLGLLWGWLPCGLAYSALLAAAMSGGPSQGAASMLAFGLGTLPAMLGLSLAGSRLPRPQGTWARITGALLVGCGLWTAAVPVATIANGAHPAHIFWCGQQSRTPVGQ